MMSISLSMLWLASGVVSELTGDKHGMAWIKDMYFCEVECEFSSRPIAITLPVWIPVE